MEQFLDSCVIIHYSNYLGEESKPIIKKCFNFIENNKESFILCYASLDEISKFKIKRKNLHKEVIEKIKNPNYNIENNLDFRSKAVAKQLYFHFKHENPIKLASKLLEQRRLSNFKINQFLSKSTNKKVIPLNQIDNELVSKIHNYINNHADCKILASALQYQKENKLFLFITADSDFNPKDYEFLKDQFEIAYSKENWKFPQLKNLLFETN